MLQSILNPAGVIAFSLILFALSSPAAIPAHVPSPLRMPPEFPVIGYGLTNAFGDLTFEQPVVITSPPGETNRLFVAERTGRIMVITNLASPTKTEFIDLGLGELQPAYVEAGLLGLTFHHGYETNGYFFVFRTIASSVDGLGGFYDEVARFQADPQNPNRALPGSKLRILAQYDMTHLHNAGDIQFGPDGYLYIATGYEGPPPGKRPNIKQSIDEHVLGGILRIDVDKRPGNVLPTPHSSVTTNYLIPADNPFIGARQFNGMTVDPAQVRTELYAVGLRNPWRITFDVATGDMYCADVGGGQAEEVNLVSPGANFGWPYYEGLFDGPERANAPSGFAQTKPLYYYNHGLGLNEGGCIIGGPVYRGARIPQLDGAYLFGDNGNGRIWALRRNGGSVAAEYLTSFPNQKTFGLTTFGIDPRNQDVLAANLEGHIKRLIYVPPERVEHARTLADTGAFADLTGLEPNPGLVPYEVNVPFWSDHATKSRWFSVPEGFRIGFSVSNNWTFPTGTVWVKHFELEMTNGLASSRRRIETRLLVKNQQGIYGVTYRWGNSRTNAELVPQGGMEELLSIRDGTKTRTQKWYYPSRADCLRCHTETAGYALGFNTAQLNRSSAGGSQNQIEGLSAAGYLDATVSDVRSFPLLAHATNTAWPIEYRVRSYLAANCAQCHYPGGPPTTHWDARFTAQISDAHIVNESSALIGDPFRVVAPRDAEHSVLLRRLSGPNRMPPLATAVLDTNAIALVAEYINTLPDAPWRREDIGSTGREGSSSISNGVHRVAGAGTNIAGVADQFHFLFQPLRANGHLIARLTSRASVGKSGIMFRQSLSPSDRYAMVAIQNDKARWQLRSEAGAETLQAAHQPGPWLRLLREGTTIAGFGSEDGVRWIELGSTSGFEGDFFAGLAVTSLDNAVLATAAFDNASLLSVSLSAETLPTPLFASDTVEFEPEVIAQGTAVERVEFYSGTQMLGQSLAAPYRFRWTNLIAGLHSIRARAVDAAGNAVFSEPVELAVQLPHARSRFSRTDIVTRGNWRPRYGREGSILAGDSTNLSAHTTFAMAGADLKTLTASNEARALRRMSGPGRVAAVWTSPTNFTFNLSLLDGELHSVSLYFVDFDTRDGRVQKVDVIDPESGQVLQSQTISQFSRGTYVTFFVRGAVQFRVSSVSGPGAILSGIFIHRATSQTPRLKVVSAAGKLQLTLPGNVVLSAKVTGGGMPPATVEMLADGRKIGEASAPLYSMVWSNVPPGVYSVVARGVDPLGTIIRSSPVTLIVNLPPGAAEEMATDMATRGVWRGVYGGDGHAIAAHATNFPAYADVSFTTPPVNAPHSTPAEYIWSAFTTDPRALLREDGNQGIMSAWLWPEFTIDVVLRDGNSHIVTLYFLDPESARLLRVEVIDPAKGQIIGQREITRFDGYISWRVRGHVRFRIAAILGNSVVSGIFFDRDANNREKKEVPVPDITKGVRLDLLRTPDGVELSWPAAASTVVLQSKDPFGSSSTWSVLPNLRVVSGNRIVVRDSVNGAGKFYRLVGQ